MFRHARYAQRELALTKEKFSRKMNQSARNLAGIQPKYEEWVMSRGVNKVILVRNLGADPETRDIHFGSAVTNIRIATSEAGRTRRAVSRRSAPNGTASPSITAWRRSPANI